jgi:hypothetical protein
MPAEIVPGSDEILSIGREGRQRNTYYYTNFNPSWARDDQPIVNVTWNDALSYAHWAHADLPTEAQWEKAARGTDGRKFPWGNDFDATKLWCSQKAPFDAGGTHKVGTLGVSPYGCTDMAGNVDQWCKDWWDGRYLKSDHGADPAGPDTGSCHVLRGGAWDISASPKAWNFLSAHRAGNAGPPQYLNYGVVGFRCAVAAEGATVQLAPSQKIPGALDASQPTTIKLAADEPASGNRTTRGADINPTQSNASLVLLREGGIAFVRVKQYTTLSGDPTIQDGMGGTGYVLRNLHPESVSAPVAQPTDKDATFTFGESVTLIEKRAGLPGMWLVSKGQTKLWIPGYILTANKAEIDLLQNKGRIPDSMAFVYGDGNWKTWGTMIGGIAQSAIIESHGIVMLDYPDGTSPFAIKGNAVLFDASVANATWKKPPVFDGSGKALALSPTIFYYCVSDGDKPVFEGIDLSTTK